MKCILSIQTAESKNVSIETQKHDSYRTQMVIPLLLFSWDEASRPGLGTLFCSSLHFILKMVESILVNQFYREEGSIISIKMTGLLLMYKS